MISFAARLTRQSPSPSYGHGWIMGKNGKRWHPCNDQRVLLRDLTVKQANSVKRVFGLGG